MPDLLSLVMRLQPTEKGKFSVWAGRALHAWFLGSLRRVDPLYAQTLHDANRLNPFTLSSLIGAGPVESGRHRRDPSYRIRITSLSPPLTRLILETLLPQWLSEGVFLHAQPFQVLAAVTDPALEPWAGVSTYPQLWEEAGSIPLPHPSPGTSHFFFASPTAFNRTVGQSGVKMQINLPQPELVFGSLYERWKAYAPLELHPDLSAFVREHVLITYHQIETQRVSFERASKGAVTGFVGKVGFQVSGGDIFWLQQLNTLSAFALYSGVGIRTGVGLGQVRAKIT